MTLQIELLETSFQEIAPQGAAFVATFYDRLFAEFPQTRGFFASTDMQEQKKKLLGALALVIQNLRKPDVLAAALKGLGQRHEAYGVRSEHYPIVGAVLLDTFAACLGERWTPELRDAWAEAYQAVCTLRLAGTTAALVCQRFAMILSQMRKWKDESLFNRSTRTHCSQRPGGSVPVGDGPRLRDWLEHGQALSPAAPGAR